MMPSNANYLLECNHLLMNFTSPIFSSHEVIHLSSCLTHHICIPCIKFDLGQSMSMYLLTSFPIGLTAAKCNIEPSCCMMGAIKEV